MTIDINWLVEQYASFFESFGIGRNDLIAHYAVWKEQSGKQSVTDYLWYLFHVLLGETRKQVSNPIDYHRNLHDIYLMMLEFRVAVEGQKDNSLVQAIIKNRIQLWKIELPYPFQLQAISTNCCSHCEQINGQVFEADAILHNTYFATAACTKESGCSCGYIPVIATENN
jgi:hypothetical protein